MTDPTDAAAITAAYRACLASGGHVASDAIVIREVVGVGHFPFAVCRDCHVPYQEKHRRRQLTIESRGAS